MMNKESSFIQAIIEHIPVIPNVPPKPVWQFDDTRAIVFKKMKSGGFTGNFQGQGIGSLKLLYF